MQNQNSRPSPFVPETIVSGGMVDKFGNGQNPIQARYGFEFFNSLGRTVMVVLRTGVRFDIPHSPSANIRGFVIRTNYHVVGGVNVDTRDLLNDTGHTTSHEAGLIERAVVRADNRYHAGRFPHQGIVDYMVDLGDFERYGGSIYLPNLDLTLSIVESQYAPSHPHSLAGVRQSLADECELLGQTRGLTYQIRIVDRLGRYGTRYVNLGGEVFLIQPERNAEVQDGVYAVSNYPALGEMAPSIPRTQAFRFEDADAALHLYKTFNEAKTLGNPEDVYKRELEDRSRALKEREQDWASQKAEWQRDADQRKRELEETVHEQKMAIIKREDAVREREWLISQQEHSFRQTEDRFRRDQLILKETFETRSLNRKEQMEILKLIPMVLAGAGALFVAIKKLKG